MKNWDQKTRICARVDTILVWFETDVEISLSDMMRVAGKDKRGIQNYCQGGVLGWDKNDPTQLSNLWLVTIQDPDAGMLKSICNRLINSYGMKAGKIAQLHVALDFRPLKSFDTEETRLEIMRGIASSLRRNDDLIRLCRSRDGFSIEDWRSAMRKIWLLLGKPENVRQAIESRVSLNITHYSRHKPFPVSSKVSTWSVISHMRDKRRMTDAQIEKYGTRIRLYDKSKQPSQPSTAPVRLELEINYPLLERFGIQDVWNLWESDNAVKVSELFKFSDVDEMVPDLINLRQRKALSRLNSKTSKALSRMLQEWRC